MKKKQAVNKEKISQNLSHQQEQFEKQQREQDMEELRETEVSKNLSNALVLSAQGSSDETMLKVVELLHNQNGMLYQPNQQLF